MSSTPSYPFIEQRDDFVPVVFAGDSGAYPLARQLFEAFGTRSICVAPGFIADIKHSRIIDMREEHGTSDPERSVEVIRQIAREHPKKRIFVTANADFYVEQFSQIKDDLPNQVVVQCPPADALQTLNVKTSFMELCDRHHVSTPATQVATCTDEGVDNGTWAHDFPVIVKASFSTDYLPYRQQGFDKVYLLDTQEQVDDLLGRLQKAGFRGDMLLQQPVFGNDTYKMTITIYIDREGRPVFKTGTQVVLEDHNPYMIGNPVTMISRSYDQIQDKLTSLLLDAGWRGPANFDLKQDSHTGEVYVFECNPRMGRSCYFICASTVNPLYVSVKDLVDGVEQPEYRHRQESVCSWVPLRLARRYLSGDLRDRFDRLVREGHAVNPTRAAYDNLPAKRLSDALVDLNTYRKFGKWYPASKAKNGEMGIGTH